MTAHLHPDPAVVAATRDQDTVLLHTGRGRYYSTNEVGGRIWALLAVHHDADAIAAALAAEFDAPSATILGDVERFLANLRTAGLVRATRR